MWRSTRICFLIHFLLLVCVAIFSSQVQFRCRSNHSLANRVGKDGQSGGGRRRAGHLHDPVFRAGVSRQLPEKISQNQSDPGDGARTRNQPAGHERAAGGEVRRGFIYFGEHVAANFSSRQDVGAGQTAVVAAGCGRCLGMVRRQASLQRPGEPLHFCLRRHAPQRRHYVQHQGGESGGDKILLGFVRPKWKGKIVTVDPLLPGPISAAQIFFYKHPDLGAEFLRRLYADTDITILRSNEQLMDWLSAGKYAFGIGAREVDTAMLQGLPLMQFLPGSLKEGSSVTAYNGTLSYFNSRTPSQRGEGRRQLALVPRRADGVARFQSQNRRL